MDYVVCNHEQGKWVTFHAPVEADRVTCGEKPVGMGQSICNYDTEAWEPIGSVKHPDQPMCGPKPKELNDSATCDSATGEWFETEETPDVVVPACPGEPPADLTFVVCNKETGLWEEDKLAIDSATALDVATNTDAAAWVIPDDIGDLV